MPSKTVVLARHAQALDRNIALLSGISEARRPLTEEGKAIQAKMNKRAQRWIKKAEILIHSPYLRAVETSTILLEVTKAKRIETSRYLLPNSNPNRLIDKLKGEDYKCVILVGHEPNLSILLSTILEVDLTKIVQLRKSAFCLLNWDAKNNQYVLSGLLNPK